MTPHDEGLEFLAQNLDVLRIENAVNVFREVPIWRKKRDEMLTDMDLVTVTQDAVYVIELKTGAFETSTAKRQLEHGRHYIQDVYGVDPLVVYVHRADDGELKAAYSNGSDRFRPFGNEPGHYLVSNRINRAKEPRLESFDTSRTFWS